MKTILSVLTIVLLSLASCDQCKKIDCNYGTCEEGECGCPRFHTGDNCQSHEFEFLNGDHVAKVVYYKYTYEWRYNYQMDTLESFNFDISIHDQTSSAGDIQFINDLELSVREGTTQIGTGRYTEDENEVYLEIKGDNPAPGDTMIRYYVYL